MTCLYCKGPVELSIRTGNPKKYCSKKCSSKFYRNEERYYKKKNADWGTRGEKERQRKLKAQKEFEWYSTNWLTTAQVAKEIGLTITAVHGRAKKRGLKPIIRTAGSGRAAPTTFFSPEEVEIIKQPYIAKPVPIPEGYMTKEQFETAIGVGSWGMPMEYGLTRCGTHKTYNTAGRALVLSIWHESKVDLYFQRKAEREAAVQEKRLAKRLAKEAELNRAIAQRASLTEGRLSTAAAAAYIGYGVESLRRANLPYTTVGMNRYYLLQDVNRLKEKREAEKASLLAARSERGRNYTPRGVPKRKNDWTSTEMYEKRLFKSFPKKLAKCKLAGNDSKYKSCVLAVGANEEWARLASTGDIRHFTCETCKLSHPYHDFYFEASDSTNGRRLSRCKICAKAVKRLHSAKHRRNRTPEQKFRPMIACQIKSEISIYRDEYATDLSVQSIWASLPYTTKELLEHLESQFDENMNWDNHGRLMENKYTWQIDHIRPRIDFEYTTLDDPQYQECWSLDNMRPLSAKENSFKGSGSE